MYFIVFHRYVCIYIYSTYIYVCLRHYIHIYIYIQLTVSNMCICVDRCLYIFSEPGQHLWFSKNFHGSWEEAWHVFPRWTFRTCENSLYRFWLCSVKGTWWLFRVPETMWMSTAMFESTYFDIFNGWKCLRTSQRFPFPLNRNWGYQITGSKIPWFFRT